MFKLNALQKYQLSAVQPLEAVHNQNLHKPKEYEQQTSKNNKPSYVLFDTIYKIRALEEKYQLNTEDYLKQKFNPKLNIPTQEKQEWERLFHTYKEQFEDAKKIQEQYGTLKINHLLSNQ